LPVQTTPIARPSLSMIGEPDIPPTVLAPVIHSGPPPKLCTRQACHRRSGDKRNAEVSSPAFAIRSGVFHCGTFHMGTFDRHCVANASSYWSGQWWSVDFICLTGLCIFPRARVFISFQNKGFSELIGGKSPLITTDGSFFSSRSGLFLC